MPSKKNGCMSVVLALLLPAFIAGVDSPEWQRKKLEFLKMVYKTYAFTQSLDYREAPQTLGRYFTEPIYQRLKGNDLVGFQYDEGFVFSGDGIRLVECKTTAETGKYGRQFSAALAEAAKELKLGIGERASCQLGVCLVAVVEKPSKQSLPGVVLELYAKAAGSGKKLFLRIKSGSREGWNEAMRDAWGYVCLILRSSATVGGYGK